MTCSEPDCSRSTAEGKPYCGDHVARLPYVQEILARLRCEERAPTVAVECEGCGSWFDAKKKAAARFCAACRAERNRRKAPPPAAAPWQRACPVCGQAVTEGRRTYCSRRCCVLASGRRRHGRPIAGPLHPWLGRPRKEAS